VKRNTGISTILIIGALALVVAWLLIRARRSYLNKKNKEMATIINTNGSGTGLTPGEKNLKAFLNMIRYAEGTNGPNGYAVTFAYKHIIKNFADHPANTGEWTGHPLTAEQCRGAGLNPPCKSTAAGAYQFIRPTWNRLKKALNLPDFTPQSQDRAAIELIRENGSLDLVQSGKFAEAVTKVRKVWASMPGAGYSQPEKSLAKLREVYLKNGGALA
jgi:muramidase (phage lysozyme)